MTPELNASLNALILEVGSEIAGHVRTTVETALKMAEERGAQVERERAAKQAFDVVMAIDERPYTTLQKAASVDAAIRGWQPQEKK